MASSTANGVAYTTMYNPQSFRYEIGLFRTGSYVSTNTASARNNLKPDWGRGDSGELSRWLAKREEELKKRRAEKITNAFKDLM